jgi:hypothetical protein
MKANKLYGFLKAIIVIIITLWIIGLMFQLKKQKEKRDLEKIEFFKETLPDTYVSTSDNYHYSVTDSLNGIEYVYIWHSDSSGPTVKSYKKWK